MSLLAPLRPQVIWLLPRQKKTADLFGSAVAVGSFSGLLLLFERTDTTDRAHMGDALNHNRTDDGRPHEHEDKSIR
jgi:hypothetical protein